MSNSASVFPRIEDIVALLDEEFEVGKYIGMDNSFAKRIFDYYDENTLSLFETNFILISNGQCTPRIEKLANSPLAGKFKFYASETFDGRFKKPNPDFFREILKNYRNISNGRILVVGDELSTDILGANRAGLKKCLVSI